MRIDQIRSVARPAAQAIFSREALLICTPAAALRSAVFLDDRFITSVFGGFARAQLRARSFVRQREQEGQYF